MSGNIDRQTPREQELRTRRHFRLAALGAAMTVLATVLLANPASATTRTESAQVASGAVSAAGLIPDGTIRLHNVNSGKCLTYAWDRRGAAFQQGCGNVGFDGAISEWYAKNVGGNNYVFINQANGQCLSISGSSTSDGAAAFVWTCTNGLTAQIFTLVPVPQGGPYAYELVNVNSNKCVAVGGGKTNDGAWVIQWTCYGGSEMLWRPY